MKYFQDIRAKLLREKSTNRLLALQTWRGLAQLGSLIQEMHIREKEFNFKATY
jgi:hypothetical protein